MAERALEPSGRRVMGSWMSTEAGRIVFVSVGTSAISNRKLFQSGGDLPDALPPDGEWEELIRNAEAAHAEPLTRNGRVKNWARVEQQVREQNAEFEAALTDLHKSFWNWSDHKKRDPRYKKLMSAETFSTWLAGKEHRLGGGPLRSETDKVVLVVSRTCAGQMAGRINETIFREFLFQGNEEPEIVTEVINDLRLEGIADDESDATSLTEQVGKIYERHANNQDRTPLFNITGGFKGLIPAVPIVCARAGTPLLYLHENMKGTISLRFDGGQVKEEYEPFHVEH